MCPYLQEMTVKGKKAGKKARHGGNLLQGGLLYAYWPKEDY